MAPDDEDFAPDLGIALFDAAPGKPVELTRVPITSFTQRSLSPPSFVYTANLDLERTYAVTFDFSKEAYDRVLDRLPSELPRGGDVDFGCTVHVGLVARIGELEPNEGDPFRPLEVLHVNEAAPYLTIQRVNEYDFRFQSYTVDELVETLNGQVGNTGTGGARMRFLLALGNAFLRTGLDCSAFMTDGGLSIARKIRREGQRLVIAT